MSANTTSKLDFVLRLVDRISQPLGRVNASFSQLGQQGQAGIKQMGVGLAGLIGTAYSLKSAMAPALAQNAALGEVKSLGVAGDALELLNTKSLQFSVAYGENATAFVRSAYDIQSAIAGLTGTQLATFTDASNVLAKATKADAATITDYVGTMYGIFKQQADVMGKGEWVENLTGQTALAVQMFKTTGSQMSAAFTGIGANATSAGVGLSEQMAILGQLQSTMSGGEAGTKYKSFLSGVGSAQVKLGMKFTDSQGRLLPMLSILDKLKVKFGDTLTVADSDVLKKAFGSDEAVGLIKLLMNDTAGLANNIDQLGKVKGIDQAKGMADAMVDPWQRFASAVEAVRIVFGQKLLPTLSPIIEQLAAGGLSVIRWTTLFPNLTRVIGLTILGIVALTAGVALMTFVFGVWRTAAVPILMLWKLLAKASWSSTVAYIANAAAATLSWMRMAVLVLWLRTATTAMALWQGVIWLTNAALMANPVTWIVLGIIALVAVIVAAIYYWDEWTGALMESAAFAWVSDQLGALSSWFESMGGWSGMARAAWDGIVAIFHNAINSLIAMLNKIPGVDIKASFGELPAGPNLDSLDAARRAQQTINAAIPSLSPNRASAVPPGGLLTSIQNSNTQNQGVRVENQTIYNNKPMTPHQLKGLMDMAG
ncbi:phage tail tape measure protein [Pseudomonas sp. CCI4.2]|uniref:phage tail tape measure protein n=1 Tax=Pseudomonas sp. CCI4.2 TaxID=3048620 RepID=UPI002AC8A025|nr:phage tail tape measure protein [Pseudomonas sp. CCI4.2]MEB0090075.1 phage tail tape measure protein [Pseudomonas sp. CCI4.2]WPX53461.1 phage tail tape measure protein [Pseudomonas sp. CCI4.2]